MTNKEAIEFIKTDISRLWNTPQNLEHKEALEMAIEALEQNLVNISCKNCKNFNPKDNYCSLLQINWLPDDFGCVKGEGD